MAFWDLWFRTEEQKQTDINNFYAWAYPYGDKQKELITNLITSLITNEDISLATYNYFVVRQEYQNNHGDNIEDVIKSLKKKLNGKARKNISKYLALAKIDLNIKEDLNYPSLEEIKTIVDEYERLMK